jgi:hypothetical protein
MANGKVWAKVRYDEELCRLVTCRNTITDQPCCTYQQWQQHAYEMWTTVTTNSSTGATTYTPDISIPCNCGTLLEIVHDLETAGAMDNVGAFIDAADKKCPGLSFSDAKKMAQSCGFGTQFNNATAMDVRQFLEALLGLVGAARGESGPGWSYPTPPSLPPPAPRPNSPGLGGRPPR